MKTKQTKQLKKLSRKEMKSINGGTHIIVIDKNGNIRIKLG